MIEEVGGDYLQWLRGFYYVAKTGSFSLAGLEMGRHQTTITHQVKCLESMYGVTLIDRSKGKCEYTKYQIRFHHFYHERGQLR